LPLEPTTYIPIMQGLPHAFLRDLFSSEPLSKNHFC